MMEHMGNEAKGNTAEALEAVPKSYDSAIDVLAAAHGAGPDPVEIYSMRDPRQQIVRLIEVSAAFPEGGVERPAPPNRMERVVPVFPMGPAKDFPYRSEIVQVTPSEWEQLLGGKLKLNQDWGDLHQAQRVLHGK